MGTLLCRGFGVAITLLAAVQHYKLQQIFVCCLKCCKPCMYFHVCMCTPVPGLSLCINTAKSLESVMHCTQSLILHAIIGDRAVCKHLLMLLMCYCCCAVLLLCLTCNRPNCYPTFTRPPSSMWNGVRWWCQWLAAQSIVWHACVCSVQPTRLYHQLLQSALSAALLMWYWWCTPLTKIAG